MMGRMRTPTDRDETTLRIVTALALFVGVLVAGWVLLAVAGRVGLSDAVGAPLFVVLLGGAVAAAAAYLLRRRV
jgi:hypothetical protein